MFSLLLQIMSEKLINDSWKISPVLLLSTKQKFPVTSTIFLKKIGSATHRVTQNLVVEGEMLIISMLGKKKFLERHSNLRLSQKELRERHSSSFRHKNTPASTYE
jgi:hypothetical protein